MESNKIYRILSIDGGGIKGLYSSKILQTFEETYNVKISDCFNLICGTSTGGLIALALSKGMAASEICQFYKTWGKEIFPNRFRLQRAIRNGQQLLWRSKYSGNNLESALKAIFKESKIGDSQTHLCIPSFNITLGKNRVFKYDHSGLKGTDNDLSMVDVALATSAAPTYLPFHNIGSPSYIDGGIWANNPSLCGLLEGINYFLDNGYHQLSILSIGSLNSGSGFQPLGKWYSSRFLNYKRYSVLDWGSKLFQFTLDGQSEFADFFLTQLHNKMSFPCNYLRVPSWQIDSDNIKSIGMDKTRKNSLDLMEIYGRSQGLKYVDFVKPFFDSPKM